MLLNGKNAVIYGAGGAVGSAVARAFAAMATGRPRPRHLEIPLDLLDTLGIDRPETTCTR